MFENLDRHNIYAIRLFFIEHNIDDTSREIAGAKKNEFGTSTGKYAT